MAPPKGRLTCEQLESRFKNARTDRGRNRSVSSGIRRGCGWAAAMPVPNPCEPKPRAFVTKADREVAFATSGGDCPPGVRADPTEAQKQTMKDAKAACAGVRPSADFKRCVIDAFRAMSDRSKAAQAAPPSPPRPPEPPSAPLAPPAFTATQLPPHLAALVPQLQAVINANPTKFQVQTFPAPRPTPPIAPRPTRPMAPPMAMMPAGPNALPPIPPPMPSPLTSPPEPFSSTNQDRMVAATKAFLESDYPLRAVPEDILLGPFLTEYEDKDKATDHRIDYWNYLRTRYPTIPVCDRLRLRRKATMGRATQHADVLERVAADLVRGYGR